MPAIDYFFMYNRKMRMRLFQRPSTLHAGLVRSAVGLFLSVVPLAGCSESLIETAAPDAVRVTPTSLRLQPQGSARLTITAFSKERIVPGVSGQWSSSAQQIAIVDNGGLVTAYVRGRAEMTVRIPGSTVTSSVRVDVIGVSNVAVAPASATLLAGRTLQLIPTVSADSGATIPTLIWASNNPAVATVSMQGIVTAVSTGQALISVQCEGRTATALIVVTRPSVGSVSLSPSTLSLVIGQTATITPTVRDENGLQLTDRIVTWESSSSAVASVSAAGVVTAISAGTVTITANVEGMLRAATVTVSPLPASVGFRTVVAGYGHACGIRTDDVVFCWGRNSEGQLGTGDTQNRSVPTRIRGSLRFSHLALGFLHSCGLTTSGEAYCWGSGDQLGVGSSAMRTEPTMVLGGLAWLSLTAGELHTCGVTISGEGYCWGFGRDDGQLGIGTYESRNVPSQVRGALTFRIMAAGAYHTCGITVSGVSYCWGRNDYGALGIGSKNFFGDPAEPVPVATLLRFRSIAGGADNSCGVSLDQRGYCWGSDWFERLGNGPASESLVPMAMSFNGTITQLSLGPVHGCLLETTGMVYCWGDNSAGQLGDNSLTTRSVPVAVTGLSDIVSVSAMGRAFSSSEYFSCATRRDQKAFCWGGNGFGQLGDGTTIRRITPVEVRLP